MKKATSILLCLIIVTLLFSACTKSNNSSTQETNPFENYNSNSNSSEQNTVYIDSGVVGNENMQFEYNGKEIEFDYRYNSSEDCEMGLQLFVNGILQEFYVNNEKFTVYKTECKANTDNVFHVSFTPNTGKKGETASLIFANIYNPEIIELNNTVNTFGNNHKISQPMPWGIKMNKDSTTTEPNISKSYKEHKFTQEELNEFTKTLNDGTKASKLDNFMKFEISKDINIISLSDEKSVVFDLYGNFEGTYRISLYGDFKKIDINGNDYLDINVKKNTKYSIKVDTKDFSDYKNIYAVAVSLDNTEGLVKSDTYFIKQ